MRPRPIPPWQRPGGPSARPSRTRIALAWLAVAAALAAAPLAGQPLQELERYEWRTFDTGDGLPISEVRDLEQGADGYLYAATARGLVRFDGRTFEPVALEGLRSEIVDELFRDRSGRLWILSGEGELAVLEEGGVRALPEPDWGADGAPRMTTNRTILSEFSQTADGDVWLVDDDGLVRVRLGEDARMVRYGQEQGLPRDSVLAFTETDEGEWIVTARGGFFRAQGSAGGDGELRPTRFERIGPPVVARNGVRSDGRGVWAALTDGTLLRYAHGTFRRFGEGATPLHLDSLQWRPGRALLPAIALPLPGSDSVPSDGSLRLVGSLVTRDGERFARATEITVGDARPRLFRLGDHGLREVPLGEHVAAISVTTMLEDHEGSLWLATSHGLVRMSPLRVAVLPDDHELAGSFTVPVLQTRDGSVWVGTWGEGLRRFGPDGSEERVTLEDGLPSPRIRSLYQDRRGWLWIGTVLGLVARDTLGVMHARRETSEARGFAEDAEGRLWVATRDELLVDEGEGLRRVPDGGWEGAIVRAMLLDPRRGIWLGTESGLFLRRPDGRTRHFGRQDGLRDDLVASLYEEEDGTLWVGTYADGLHRYRGGRFVPVTTAEGLHHDGIWGIVPDDEGGYWMSSDGGLARVERAELHRVADAVERGDKRIDPLRPIVFGTADGMRNVEMNRASPAGVRLRDGRIVFNGIEGIHVIDPERALRPAPPSPTVVDAVTVDGASLAAAGPLRVTPPPRHVSFEFRALSFADADRAEYRYRLDGYDDDWVYGGTRPYAAYTNLGPGSYTLVVENRVRHGSWGGAHSGATLTIPPRFWQRDSFLPAVAIALVVALGLAHRARVRRLLGVERMRLQIAADLHDQVGSSLSSIVLLSEMLGESGAEGATRTRQLRRIGEAAAETANALRDVIWVVDPENDRLSSLIDRMRKTAEEMLPDTPVSFDAKVDEEVALTPEFQRHAFLIFKETLHNAAKHARAPRVDVEVEAVGGRLRFSVRDRGVGFEVSAPGRGYGLRTMRRRAEKIDGELHIVSAPGEGTHVALSAPMA